MLNVYLVSLIMLLSVLGIYFLIKEITALIIKNRCESCVILKIYDDADSAENMIRNALTANPESDIIIVDKSKNAEVSHILSKFEKDYTRVHIKTAPEK